MITCFIVDDEPIARQGLREYITREGDIKILAECETIPELRMRLLEMSPDIIFLDIEMPYTSGMDWLSTANTSSLVILTTAYEQYALRSYDFNVTDYLLKPIPYERFSKAIAKARKMLQKDIETEGVDYMLVKVTQTKKHKILFRDITYIEARQNVLPGSSLIHSQQNENNEYGFKPYQYRWCLHPSLANIQREAIVT